MIGEHRQTNEYMGACGGNGGHISQQGFLCVWGGYVHAKSGTDGRTGVHRRAQGRRGLRPRSNAHDRKCDSA